MRIFLCDVGNIPQDVLKKAAERLPASRSPKEGVRADAFAARVAGTLLALYAIRQISPESVCDIWGTTAEGKPFIQNCPVAFSITHAYGIVGVAVSGNHPVGLDVEKIRPLAKLPNVYCDISSSYSYVADPAEKERLKTIMYEYDPTHIFYGSDYPIWCPKKELEKVKMLGFDETFLEDLLFNNFANFYHYKKL